MYNSIAVVMYTFLPDLKSFYLGNQSQKIVPVFRDTYSFPQTTCLKKSIDTWNINACIRFKIWMVDRFKLIVEA